MERTIREHIDLLVAKLDQIVSEQMAVTDKNERNVLERDIEAVRIALAHYRSGLEIEQEVNGHLIFPK